MLYKVEVHDLHFLKNTKQQCVACQNQLDLFQSVKVKLETPMRINKKNNKRQPYIFRKSQKRIETFFLNYVTNS